MVSNPFDQVDGQFVAIVNDERQYSLWPALITVPDGWRTVYGPDIREHCLEWIEQMWTDMRPASLVERMGG